MPGSFSERIYYRMPVLVQNAIFSGHGWNLSRKRYGRFFCERLAMLKEMEWWSSERIEEYQDENAAKIVRHAYETVPFYRNWYEKNGVDINAVRSTADLRYLPILTKQLVRANQQEMISSSFRKGSLIKGLTSGTSGTR